MLKFSAANTKLKKLYKLATTVLKRWLGQKIGRSTAKIYSFDILSGVDCPFAFNCKSQAEEQADGSRRIRTGQIQNSVAFLLVKKYYSPIHTKVASVTTTLFMH